MTTEREYLVYIRPDDAMLRGVGLDDEQRKALALVDQNIAGKQTLDDAMNLVFRAIMSTCPCNRLSLHMLEADGLRMVARWVGADYEPILLDKGYIQDLPGSSLLPILNTGVIRMIRDLETYLHERPSSEPTRALIEEGNKSSLTCPLLVDGRAVGILFASSRQRDAFSAAQVLLHQAVAGRLGQTVEKVYRIEQLSATNQAYMEMLSFVVHELKGSLGAMMLNLQVINRGRCGPVTREQQRRLERVIRRGNYLTGFIREYLSLARMEEGNAVLRRRTNVDLVNEVIQPAIDDTSEARSLRNMTLRIWTSGGKGRVDGDPDLLRFVVVNLLGNAVKYGRDDGVVKVSIRRRKDRVYVAVRNEGCGFRDKDVSRLFRKFQRLNDPAAGDTYGTGVGLYTAARIVRMHHGKMHAHSKYGEWADFSFYLPAHAPVDGMEGNNKETTMAKVYIVDDDRDLVDAMKVELEAAGFDVAAQYDDRNLVERVLAFGADIILLDVMFPGSKSAGFEMARSLRRTESLKRTPVIMLTGINVEGGYPVKFSECDIDDAYLPVTDFMDKPVEMDELIEKVKILTA